MTTLSDIEKQTYKPHRLPVQVIPSCCGSCEYVKQEMYLLQCRRHEKAVGIFTYCPLYKATTDINQALIFGGH